VSFVCPMNVRLGEVRASARSPYINNNISPKLPGSISSHVLLDRASASAQTKVCTTSIYLKSLTMASLHVSAHISKTISRFLIIQQIMNII
jgi:hypothetical protein